VVSIGGGVMGIAQVPLGTFEGALHCELIGKNMRQQLYKCGFGKSIAVTSVYFPSNLWSLVPSFSR
jgi:hypothetical protein